MKARVALLFVALALASCARSTALDVVIRFDSCLEPRTIYRLVLYMHFDGEPEPMQDQPVNGMWGYIREVDGRQPREFVLVVDRSQFDLRDGLRVRLRSSTGRSRPVWIWGAGGDSSRLLFARAADAVDPIRTEFAAGEVREVTLTFACTCPGMPQCGAMGCGDGAGCSPCLAVEADGAWTTCNDLFDNDCSTLTGDPTSIDCTDPSCAIAPQCGVTAFCPAGSGCPIEPELNCANGLDDNGNALVDCDDPSCSWALHCTPPCPTAEECFNGLDDNCNGLVDSFDPQCRDCTGARAIREAGIGADGLPLCADGCDNDGDGLLDCFDSDCASDPACSVVCLLGVDPAAPEVCTDGCDNDLNGLVDCADPTCCNIDPAACCGVGSCAPCIPPPR